MNKEILLASPKRKIWMVHNVVAPRQCQRLVRTLRAAKHNIGEAGAGEIVADTSNTHDRLEGALLEN